MATIEEKEMLRMKLRDSFQEVQSSSSRSGYATRKSIDLHALEELLEVLIESLVEE